MRIAVLGCRLSGVHSGAHLTHLELAGYLAARGHRVEYAALQGETRTRFGNLVLLGGPQMLRAVQRADVVMVRDEPKATVLLPYLKKPTLYTCHSPAGDPRALGLKVLPPSAVLVWVSASLKAQAEDRWGTYPGENLVIEGLPIDPARYRTDPGRAVTLVNLSLRKGGALFWELARRMPETEFLGVKCWGDQIIPAQPLPNVRIAEKIRDPRAFYGWTRIILLPSAETGTVAEPSTQLPAWGEAWNRVGVEAACSGIPAIASPVAGIQSSLGGAALYVDRDDVDGWENAIRNLQEPVFWEERSRIALAHAAAVSAWAKDVLDDYEAVLSNGVPA